jgi:hypothetical protein
VLRSALRDDSEALSKKSKWSIIEQNGVENSIILCYTITGAFWKKAQIYA